MSNELLIINDAVLSGFLQQLEQSSGIAEAMTVNDLAEAKIASDNIGVLRRIKTGLDSRRKELVKPEQDRLASFKAEVDAIIASADLTLKILEKKYTAYVLEQERIAKEEAEAERQMQIAAEKAKAAAAEAEILRVAELHGLDSLVDQAIAVNEESERRIEVLASTTLDVGKMAVRGQGFTTSIKDNWTGKVVDWPAFLTWIIRTERWSEMLDAKNLKQVATSQKIEGVFNGILIANERGLSSR